MSLRDQVTAILEQVGQADRQDRQVFDRLVPVVYEELRRLARSQLAREERRFTLDTTALVHEAYLKLVDGERTPVESRAYFFGAAVRAMRQVLVDAARRRQRHKRGSGVSAVELDPEIAGVDATAEEVLVLDLALSRLASDHPRPAQVFEHRYFGGLEVEEMAATLELTPRTVQRDLAFARAWLRAELAGGVATASREPVS